jgi:hypothetical protein
MGCVRNTYSHYLTREQFHKLAELIIIPPQPIISPLECFSIRRVMEVIAKMTLCPFGSKVHSYSMILVKVFLTAVL